MFSKHQTLQKNKAQFLFSGLVTSNHRVTAATSEARKSTKKSPRKERGRKQLWSREGRSRRTSSSDVSGPWAGGGGGDRLRADSTV